MKKWYWTKEEDKRLHDLIEKDFTLSQIAKELGRSESSIKNRYFRTKKKTLFFKNDNKSRVERAIRLKEQGVGFKQIAEEIGVTVRTIYTWTNTKKEDSFRPPHRLIKASLGGFGTYRG